MNFNFIKATFIVALFTVVVESVVLVYFQFEKEDLIERLNELERDQYIQSSLLITSSVFINQAEMINGLSLSKETKEIKQYRHALSFIYADGVKLVFSAANSLPLELIPSIMSIHNLDDLDGLELPEGVDDDLEKILNLSYNMTDNLTENNARAKEIKSKFNDEFAKVGQKAIYNISEKSIAILNLKYKRNNIDSWIRITIFLAVSLQILMFMLVFVKESQEHKH